MNRESKTAEFLPNVRAWHLMDEGRWLMQFVFTTFLAISLITYDMNDPCWSVATRTENIHNDGGWLGAVIADYCYFFWGCSAIWLLVGMIRWTFIGFFQLIYRDSSCRFLNESNFRNKSQDNPMFLFFGILGFKLEALFSRRLFFFFLLLFSSSAIESLRFWSFFQALYYVPGGVFGDCIGQTLIGLVGFTGGTLLLITLIFISISIWWDFSWLHLAELLGNLVIQASVVFGKKFFSTLKIGDNHNKSVEEYNNQESVGRISSEERLNQIHLHKNSDIEDRGKKNSIFPEHEEDMPQEKDLEVAPVMFSENASYTRNDICKAKTEGNEETYQQMSMSPVFVSSVNFDLLPSLDLLDKPPVTQERVSDETISFTKKLIEKKLNDFGVSVKVHDAFTGPIVTRYEIEPDVGIKGSQIVNLAKDLARSFSLVSIRVVETIPGKNLMALELPNSRRQVVKLSEILGAEIYQRAISPLTICLGKDIAGTPVCADLSKMPHLLVAGTTGSGKSVGINAMILSLLYKASSQQVRLILIDPKMLELSVYEGIPHLLCPVVTDMSQAVHALNWAIAEMDRRYKLMSKLGVRNLEGYNAKIINAHEKGEAIMDPSSVASENSVPLEILPAIVIVIDELADLVMVVGKKIEELIARIAQKARAAGIHLVLATQRPSVDVITGLIKANIPTRIAFQVSSKIDSRTILDQQGADTLLGMGDMLYLPPGSGTPLRVHGAFVSDEEVARVVENLRSTGEPNYIEGLLNGTAWSNHGDIPSSLCSVQEDIDPLYDQAVEIVLKHRRASISLVQRHLRIGYNRAARLLEQMENAQMVSPMGANGNREILVPTSESM